MLTSKIITEIIENHSRFSVCRNSCVATSSLALNVWFTANGMCAKNNTHIYVVRTSNNTVISSGDVHCCLLPQSEALHTCRSGFPIATAATNLFQVDVDKWWNYPWYCYDPWCCYEKQWCWSWGCIGCNRVRKSIDLLKIWAKALKILVQMAPNVVWLHEVAPKVWMKNMKTLFWRWHQKEVFMIFVGENLKAKLHKIT